MDFLDVRFSSGLCNVELADSSYPPFFSSDLLVLCSLFTGNPKEMTPIKVFGPQGIAQFLRTSISTTTSTPWLNHLVHITEFTWPDAKFSSKAIHREMNTCTSSRLRPDLLQ